MAHACHQLVSLNITMDTHTRSLACSFYCLAACASEAPSQASSYAGPLTSAMTSSKVMRAVRDQATRSDSAAPPGGHGAGSNRLGPRDSLDSTGSSMASETGVVNSPMVEKQQQQQPGARLW